MTLGHLLISAATLHLETRGGLSARRMADLIGFRSKIAPWKTAGHSYML